MNRWEIEELKEQYEDCNSPSYNRFSGYLDYDLSEALDLLVEKLTPTVIDEFMETEEGFDALIECMKTKPSHNETFNKLGYEEINRNDLLEDKELRDYIRTEMIPIAENVARYRIRTA